MFLQTLTETNRPLVDAAFALHRSGKILPDTYVIDLDMVIENARKLKEAGDRNSVDLYFMSKQMGRNPHLCKLLVDLGYPGAVVVDYREAAVMMRHKIPIAHAGHLVQMPDRFLPELLWYGARLITVYTLEKAARISEICSKTERTQDICLRVVCEGDLIYPGQEGGVHLSQLQTVLEQLEQLPNIRVTALTAFPCFLYSRERRKTEETDNLQTVLEARRIAKSFLGRDLELNLPSCTQAGLIPRIAELGGKSAEPGSSLIGTAPNNEFGEMEETLAIAYVSEISHNYGKDAYCYGGGFYPRGNIRGALVGTDASNAKLLKTVPLPAGNIDYCMTLQGNAAVGDGVVMCFRPQIFTSRSHVALLEGVSTGNAKIAGIYDAGGRLYG